MLLSEMFGVERDVEFGVEMYGVSTFKVSLNDDGIECLMIKICSGEWGLALLGTVLRVISIAPAGIIHLHPPLTDEQREQLKAIWTLGGRWLAKDETGNVFAYDSKPQKIMNCSHWNNDEDYECFTVMRELSVCAIVSWSDPEPLDIGKALRYENKNNT